MRRLKTDDLAKFAKFEKEMDRRRRSLPRVNPATAELLARFFGSNWAQLGVLTVLWTAFWLAPTIRHDACLAEIPQCFVTSFRLRTMLEADIKLK
jgi:hypothetical protein